MEHDYLSRLRRAAIQHKKVSAKRKTPSSTRISPRKVFPKMKAIPPTSMTVNPIMTDAETKIRDDQGSEAEETSADMKRPTPRDLILYVLIAIIVTLLVYFLPEPFILAIPTAFCSAVLLTGIGVPSVIVIDWVFGAVYVVGMGFTYQIVRECTGIQVIAVFAGLILPLPRGTWSRKFFALSVVTVLLFVANVLRVIFEIWLVYWGILPWEVAHYPMSFVLGVVGVFVLCLVAIWLMPGFIETFEDMIYYLFPPKEKEALAEEESRSVDVKSKIQSVLLRNFF